MAEPRPPASRRRRTGEEQATEHDRDDRARQHEHFDGASTVGGAEGFSHREGSWYGGLLGGGSRRLRGPAGSRRIRIDPVPQFFGYEIDTDAARSVIEITENAFAVAEGAKHGLVLLGRFHAKQ